MTSTFGTLPADPPSTARGLASAAVTPGVLAPFQLGVLASSSGGNLVSHAGARASIADVLTVSLPAGTPTATIGVTFTVTGFDHDDGGLIDQFLASIAFGPLSAPTGISWGEGDLSPPSPSTCPPV